MGEGIATPLMCCLAAHLTNAQWAARKPPIEAPEGYGERSLQGQENDKEKAESAGTKLLRGAVGERGGG